MAARLGGPSHLPVILRRVPSYYRDPAAPAVNCPLRVGALALIERDGALLVEQRAEDGTWGLVGGALEDRETILETLVREIHEETGLETRRTELFGIFSDPTRIVAYNDGNVYRVLALVFRVEVRSGSIAASDESLDLRFVPLGDLRDLDLTPAHRPIVEAYLDARPHVVVE